MAENKLTSLLSRLVKDGVFGEGTFLSIQNENEDVKFQFASVLSMLELRILKGIDNVESFHIVTKTQISDQYVQKSRDCRSMFFNEIMMYRDVLPFLNTSESALYPKYYYGYVSENDNIESDILIVQNLKQLGFTSDKEKVFLDYNHLAVAMETIGKFHSWSYSAKQKNYSKFMELASKLRLIETKTVEDFSFSETTYLCMKRGIVKTMETSSSGELLINFLIKFESFDEAERSLWTPEEPFGVIIHGDYCKNNTFFKYDSSGRPLQQAFFDLQISRYGCPVSDLALFLYMHTNSDTREKYWSKLLQIYWDSVRDNVAQGTDLPTFEDFLEYFARKAVVGYIPVSFYLPLMIYEEPESAQRFFTMSSQEKTNFLVNKGGEQGQLIISEVVTHLLKMGYIAKFLESYKNN